MTLFNYVSNIPFGNILTHASYMPYSQMRVMPSVPMFIPFNFSSNIPTVLNKPTSLFSSTSFFNPFSFMFNGFNSIIKSFSSSPIISGITRRLGFSSSATISYGNKGSAYVRSQGYNSQKGQKLAQAARQGMVGRFVRKCASYVKKAISRAGLGNYKTGANGCDIADAYRNSKNFKEISAAGVDLKKLPAGCILCYGKGVSGYNGRYGHTEITLGNGQAVSDGVTRNIRPGARILIPV